MRDRNSYTPVFVCWSILSICGVIVIYMTFKMSWQMFRGQNVVHLAHPIIAAGLFFILGLILLWTWFRAARTTWLLWKKNQS